MLLVLYTSFLSYFLSSSWWRWQFSHSVLSPFSKFLFLFQFIQIKTNLFRHYHLLHTHTQAHTLTLLYSLHWIISSFFFLFSISIYHSKSSHISSLDLALFLSFFLSPLLLLSWCTPSSDWFGLVLVLFIDIQGVSNM